MREIKFRAWDGEKMTDKIELHFAHGLRLVSTSDLGFDKVGDDKCILMQFTGLKDKNGREIYEGDICKHQQLEGGVLPPNPAKNVQITWTELHNGWICDDGVYRYSMQPSQLEIIGNIYENPELLK